MTTRRSVVAGIAATALGGPAFAAARLPRVAIRSAVGTIVVELAADRAPVTVANFLRYVDRSLFRRGLGLGEKSGELSVDAAYTLLLKRRYVLDPSSEQTISDTVGVFGVPKWKGVVRTSYGFDGGGVSWTLRHYSSMRASTQIDRARFSPAYTGDVFYNDISGWVRLTKTITLAAGLNNAFDRAPPRIPGAEAGGANFELGYQAGVYDVIGRTLFASIRFAR